MTLRDDEHSLARDGASGERGVDGSMQRSVVCDRDTSGAGGGRKR